MMNTMLKLALLTDLRPQYQIAEELGWSESRLSRVITGRVDLTEEEKEQLAKVLGRTAPDLFPGVL